MFGFSSPDDVIGRDVLEFMSLEHPDAENYVDMIESFHESETDAVLSDARSLVESFNYDKAAALLKSVLNHPS